MQQEYQQLSIDDLQHNVCSSTSNAQDNTISCNVQSVPQGLPTLQHLFDLPKNCIVTEFNEFEDYMQFCVETIQTKQLCPNCSSVECVIKDYRTHFLHDTPILSKPSILILKKRRYRCKTCGKKFLENFSFISTNARITKRLEATIRFKLLQIQSIKRISLDLGISTDTVKKIIDSSEHSRPHLPQILSADEFSFKKKKSEKFCCTLVDVESRCVIDVLPERTKKYLISYFQFYDLKQREQVKYFISDMYKPYVEMAYIMFPNAIICIDKFHFVKLVTEAFQAVRRRVQENLVSKRERKIIKAPWKLFLKHRAKLSQDVISRVDNALELKLN